MKKSFPVHAVLSLYTGYLVSPSFDDCQEIAEWVAGHSLWTHEFADRALWQNLSARLLEQHPSLEDVDVFAPPKPATKEAMMAYIESYVAAECARLGATELSIEQGTEARTEDPLESARRLMGPDKPILGIVVEK